MNDVTDLSDTIKPKSDQLNADDFITGPITATIYDVKRTGSADQPISLDVGMGVPYKPNLTMRRILVTAWGRNGAAWTGRSLTLYRNNKVKFGKTMGGIQISHASHIEKDITTVITISRNRREEYTLFKLDGSFEADHSAVIEHYKALSSKDEIEKYWSLITQDQQQAIIKALEV